ncbi:IMP cyclohydrolase [Thermosipho ferrireducens]|uniref:IMP cyclohydrolase n=1 Tax=Thermosipho ferrireducens TaxID=2571116 RepID=A0ABX7S7V7_9BACT|nr:IMP cyclohydrolase [Thermosipho ferrireducens]QTA37885.1 IMP cyclohydrolase [Thermosipho ferrireducens]
MNIKRALISVSNKEGIVEFSKELQKRGVEIISTGGTAKLLEEAGIKVIHVSNVTEFPEILEGRVKTLHPKIFGGILAKFGNRSHQRDLLENGIVPIDMVVVTLYPFDKVSRETRTEDKLIDSIDIGGVALLRAAAKNHRDVVVVCDPEDYEKIIKSIDECGDVTLHDRRILALKAFYKTMRYDAAVHKVFSELFASEKFEHHTLERLNSLNYGDNPHQFAELLREIDESNFKFKANWKLSLKELRNIYTAFKISNELPDAVISISNGVPTYVSLEQEIPQNGKNLYIRKVDENVLSRLKNFEIIITYEIDDKLFYNSNIKIVKLEKSLGIEYDEVKLGNFVARQELDKTNGKFSITSGNNYSENDIILGITVSKYVRSHAVIATKDAKVIGVANDPEDPLFALKLLISKLDLKDSTIVSDTPVSKKFVEICCENGAKTLVEPGGKYSPEEFESYDITLIQTGVTHYSF